MNTFKLFVHQSSVLSSFLPEHTMDDIYNECELKYSNINDYVNYYINNNYDHETIDYINFIVFYGLEKNYDFKHFINKILNLRYTALNELNNDLKLQLSDNSNILKYLFFNDKTQLSLKDFLNNFALFKKGLTLFKLEKTINFMNEIAKNGCVEIMKYVRKKKCPWNEYTCSNASEFGQYECLKYAHENGCHWDEYTCYFASENGYLECLKYAHVNGCPWDTNTCTSAGRYGHLECLKYAHGY